MLKLSCTVSEKNGDFGQTLHIFPAPLYLKPPLTGFPLEFCNSDGVQNTRMMSLPDRQKV